MDGVGHRPDGLDEGCPDEFGVELPSDPAPGGRHRTTAARRQSAPESAAIATTLIALVPTSMPRRLTASRRSRVGAGPVECVQGWRASQRIARIQNAA